MNRIATTPTIPIPYQARRRMTDWGRPATGSSYSAAPKRCASSRNRTSSNVRPSAIRTRSVCSIGPSGLVGAEHRQERLLRDLDGSDALHPPLALFLPFEQLSLARDVATVAFGKDVLAQRPDRFPCDH